MKVKQSTSTEICPGVSFLIVRVCCVGCGYKVVTAHTHCTHIISLSLSLSLYISDTHMHMHTHIHIPTHMHTHLPLQAAFMLMRHIGGKLLLFQTSPPSLGPGKVR